ncbi:MAG TPA: hypothetical protein VGI10_16215 [Polyangiaceae bacterium]|jgi:hypothetical protein
MLIGGIAVIAHGVQRMTTDIDAVVQGDALPVATLIDFLRGHRIVPRVANAEAFAAANLVLLVRHQPTQVDLDLSFGWTAFEREALRACTSTRYGKLRAPIARVDDLLVFKAIAGRPRDVEDAATLLTLYPNVDLRRVSRRVMELAELAEAPELTNGLEQILAAVAALPRAPRVREATKPTRRAARTTPRAKKASKAKAPGRTRQRK